MTHPSKIAERIIISCAVFLYSFWIVVEATK
jgi:hypothetical protein